MNDVSKKFHHNFCVKAKQVKAKGTVLAQGGKMSFTATQIELVGE
jgi:hypothetical protein